MTLFLQQVVDGLAAGGIYGALALALVLIYRSTGIVNFGQGEMATVMVYCTWQLHEWGMPPAPSVMIGMALSFVLGVVLFRLMVRPLANAPVETVVVVTIGIFLAFQATCLWIWGSDQRFFFQILPSGGMNVLDIRITYHALSVAGVIVLIATCLSLFFRLSRLGLAMRAAAAEPDKSPLVGIPVQRMLMLGWGLASITGFLAAVLIAPKLFLSPTMMVPLLLYSLAAATLGGWHSPVGAVVGGLLVGVLESLGATYIGFIGAELRLAIPIVLTLVVLLVKPSGLFGREAVVRA